MRRFLFLLLPLVLLVLLVLFVLPRPAPSQSLDEARAIHAAGRIKEALGAYRAVAEAAVEDPRSAAIARHNACYLLLFELTDYPAALRECEEALRLRRGSGDERGLARTLNNLALVLQRLGRYGEAGERFRAALEINRRRADVEAEVVNLSNLGSLFTAAGRYTEAMRFHTSAVELARRHAAEPWAAGRILADRINYGAALEKVGAYREALEIYEEVLGRGAELAPRQLAALQVNRGVMYRNLGDPVRAAEVFAQAIEIYRDLGDRTGLSNAWLNLGLTRHLNLGRLAAAEEAYRQALATARDSGDREEEIQDLFYLGRLLLQQGRLAAAAAAFERCLEESVASGSAEGRWSAREGLGRIAEARGELATARDDLLRAIDDVERVRADLRRPRRAGYFGDKRAVYAAAVRVLAELERQEPGIGHGERALEVVQRAKARDLLDALGGGRPRALLSAEEIRRRVGTGVLLELFVGESHLFAWVVHRRGVRMLDLGPPAPILGRVEAVHRALAAGGDPSPADLGALSSALLSSPEIAAPGVSKLWIAPDGRLHYLPFELLRAGGAALVERAAVSYLPSASVLGWRRRDPRPAAVGLLAFADPVLRRSPGELATPAELLVDRFRLEPLPAAAGEVERIGEGFPGAPEIYTGAEATEEAFRRAVVRGSRVLHLATHSLVDERPGRGSAILLTPGEVPPPGGEDGVLYPEEIAALDLHVELTVLASCRSALGSIEDGRALASLTGSFLAAGSGAVIATLWDVDDAAAAAFMDQLYHQLRRGRTPAESLRRAKLRLRADRRWNRPALWAAYVLVGDAPGLVPRTFSPGWLGIAAGLVLAAAALWRARGVRRRRR